MDAQSGTERPLRSDAERNRQRVLAAAAELFAAEGIEASLEEVAARAGVGVGTLYRRFGDREGLIDALFEDQIDEVAVLAERALELDDPWEGLKLFLRESTALSVADRGLRQAVLSPARGRERAARARARIAPLATQLLEQARDDGSLREDLGAYDIPFMQLMLGTVADVTGEVDPEFWRRFLVILLDGMRKSRRAPTPLPSEALDADRYAAAMAQGKPATRAR
jgi:AcrR family transcriptional regulator